MNYKFALVGGEILKSTQFFFLLFYDVLDYYFSDTFTFWIEKYDTKEINYA